jgi:hypothetical protein
MTIVLTQDDYLILQGARVLDLRLLSRKDKAHISAGTISVFPVEIERVNALIEAGLLVSETWSTNSIRVTDEGRAISLANPVEHELFWKDCAWVDRVVMKYRLATDDDALDDPNSYFSDVYADDADWDAEVQPEPIGKERWMKYPVTIPAWRNMQGEYLSLYYTDDKERLIQRYRGKHYVGNTICDGYILGTLRATIEADVFYSGGHHHVSAPNKANPKYSRGWSIHSDAVNALLRFGLISVSRVDEVRHEEHYDVTDAGIEFYQRALRCLDLYSEQSRKAWDLLCEKVFD